MLEIKEELKKHFLPFLPARGVSGKYAYWTINDNLNRCPIVIVMDEGHIYPVSKSIKELTRLLAYNPEVKISNGSADYSKEIENDEDAAFMLNFVKTIQKKFQFNVITSNSEAREIVRKANLKYSPLIARLD